MAKHITKIRPQGQLLPNGIDSGLIKDSTLLQLDMAIGTFTGDVFMDHSIATVKLVDGDAFMKMDGTTVASSDMNLGGFKITNLANAAAPTDAVNKSQLDALADSLTVFEWQASVNAIAVDPTTLTPVVGDRFLIRGTGVGYWAPHSNQIAQFTGNMSIVAGWEYFTPTIGTVVTVDNVGDRFYMWGGTAWDEKWLEVTTASTGLQKIGFDIQIAPAAAGSGLNFTAGVLSIDQGNGLVVSDNGVAVDTGTTANKIPQYDASGNLGINTATPTARLHVVGSTRLEGDLELTGMANLDSAITFMGLSAVAAPDSSHGVVYYNSSDNRLHLRTATKEQVIGGENTSVYGEEPAGLVDGNNAIFTVLHAIVSGTEAVYMNGMRLTRDIDYSVSDNTVTFVSAPLSAYLIRVDYQYVTLI